MKHAINAIAPQEIIFNEANKLLRVGKQKLKSAAKTAGYLAPVALIAMPMAANAITAPQQGSFAYDLYDTAVNHMIRGPVGFVGGMITIIISAVNITKNWMLAGGGVLGGTALIKADSITTSLGITI